jgi:hypothetical protein
MKGIDLTGGNSERKAFPMTRIMAAASLSWRPISADIHIMKKATSFILKKSSFPDCQFVFIVKF